MLIAVEFTVRTMVVFVFFYFSRKKNIREKSEFSNTILCWKLNFFCCP